LVDASTSVSLSDAPRFAGQVAVVVGAGQGIGRATAEIMARDGATVVAVDRDMAGLNSLAEAMRSAGLPIAIERCDALCEAEVAALCERTVSQTGRIDILVNGVGGSTVADSSTTPLDEMALTDFEAIIRFNLNSTFLCCRAFIPHMKAQGHGTIVNIASIAARGEGFSNAAYSAAKAGIVALTRKLSRELGPFGVTCNAIAPGLTLSERISDLIATATDDERRRRVAQIPLGRFATPIDQARVICFLASSDAAFVSGSTIFVTGGA
jgi:NAD(P)-dependent dehydrogenase (short-subunit alcohol dehydrogenase family)